jgi:hypothetical protein
MQGLFFVSARQRPAFAYTGVGHTLRNCATEELPRWAEVAIHGAENGVAARDTSKRGPFKSKVTPASSATINPRLS